MVMRMRRVVLAAVVAALAVSGQGTVPTFVQKAGDASYTLGGRGPGSGTTTIPTLLVPVTLTLTGQGGKRVVMDAGRDVAAVAASPIFANHAFPAGGTTQYVDAMMRSTFADAADWHTLLSKPEVRPVRIDVPVGYGYVLTSKTEGKSMAVVDWQYVARELFRRVPRQDGKLVIAFAHNTTYYTLGDATVCCSWGAHGVDKETGNSYVLSSYIDGAPGVVEDHDVQPITQQLALFFKNPLHDPLIQGRNVKGNGNTFPAWTRLNACVGTGAGSMYFFLEPTNTNPKNNIPASKAFAAGRFHLQNVALLPWYVGEGDGLGRTFSFPDSAALSEPAKPCQTARGGGGAARTPPVEAAPLSGKPNGHKLIGYWIGYGGPGSPTIPLRELSPQWDVIIVAFAVPDKSAPEGTMVFRSPLPKEQMKADVAWLKAQGKTVLISLGGGGQHFTLADANRVPNFVASVKEIVAEYGFDGIDIDFESPSLSVAPGDTDYRKPTTPSIVNLISALRQLRDHFGPKFQITLVPEGTQIPSGYPSYGGQFGSYLPILRALRDVLTFVDVQDYNTPPLQGLDGEIYQPGTVDYHAAMTELLLQGFAVGGNPKMMFAPVPEDKVAVGFLTSDTTPEIVSQAMDYLITGRAPAGTRYKLRKPGGYPKMIGAMFWTIDADRRGSYLFSNVVGPQLHGYQ